MKNNITHNQKIFNPGRSERSPSEQFICSGGDRPGERSEAPCLYSNNSIEILPHGTVKPLSDYISAVSNTLTSYHKRQAETLHLNVKRLIGKEAKSPNHVAFLTLTFQKNITDHKKAYKRFRSFNTNYLSKHEKFGEWVCVKERQKRGAWHYHLVVAMSEDIKTGFDFDKYGIWLDGSRRNTFPTGNKEIRNLWEDLRENLEKYGIGKIFSLEPIRSNEEAMARYVGKYISKHMGKRDKSDKGVRLVNYSKGWTKNSVKFAWNTENAHEWRKKLALFARMYDCQELYQLSEKLGPGWAYKYQDEIINIFERLSQIESRPEKQFESPTLGRMKKNKDENEEIRRKTTTIHSKKTDIQKIKEKTKQKLGMILSSSHISKWLSEEKAEMLKNEIKKEKEEKIYRTTINQNRYLQHLVESGKKFTQTEGVPF